MGNSIQNSNLKVTIVVIGLAIIGWLGYNCKANEKVKKSQKEIQTVTNQKNDLLVDLAVLNNDYSDEIVINPNPIIISEREKVLQLIDNVIAIDKKSVTDFKKKVNAIKKETTTLSLNLKKEINIVIVQSNNSKPESSEIIISSISKDKNAIINSNLKKTIQNINDILPVKVYEKVEAVVPYTKMGIESLKVSTINISKVGIQSETNKAKDTDGLKINFTIPENKNANPGIRTYFVQIYNQNGDLVFQKGKMTIKGKSLPYSLKTDVDYKNKSTRFTENLLGNVYEKGSYNVKIFDQNEQVSEAIFNLK